MRRLISPMILIAALLGAGATPPADLPALVKALGSDDFTQRETAQKQLEQSPAGSYDALKAMAQAASDPEIKARLAQVVVAIERNWF